MNHTVHKDEACSLRYEDLHIPSIMAYWVAGGVHSEN